MSDKQGWRKKAKDECIAMLLEALIEIVGVIEGLHAYSSDDLDEALFAARAAISKATGEGE